MAHYLFNVLAQGDEDVGAVHARVAAGLTAGLWGVAAGETHRDALAPGDDALVHVAAEGVLVARVEIGSTAHDWTPEEARGRPGDHPGGVVLARVEPWEPPVPMTAVLAVMDPSEKARAHFDVGVVRITDGEHATVLAVREGR